MQHEHQQRLEELATWLHHKGLASPTRLMLDCIAPVTLLASQLALFSQPLVPRGRWHDYVDALGEESNWLVLRGLIERGEC